MDQRNREIPQVAMAGNYAINASSFSNRQIPQVMSTTKIIKGYLRPATTEAIIKSPYGLSSPLWEVDLNGDGTPATLYIGTGKLWTEEEVRGELARKDAEIAELREEIQARDEADAGEDI